MRQRDVDLGFLCQPDDGEAPVPGVVLVHDVWGLGDHARDLTARLAAEGFAVLGIDLYRREPNPAISDPGAWMRAMSDPLVLSDIVEAARFLRALPATRGCAVGVIGFCMGGMYALLAACDPASRGLVSAAVPFYGILSHAHGLLHDDAGLDVQRKPIEPLAAAHGLHCPLLGFFGGEDPYVPQSDVRALKAAFDTAEPSAEVVVVEGAGHAFMNDTRPESFREAAARDAWRRMVAFLESRLAA